MINFLFLHCSSSRSLRSWQSSQIWWFFRSVQSGTTLWTSLNFKINSVRYIVFTPRASEICKIQQFCRKKSFFGLQRLLERKQCTFGIGHNIQSCCRWHCWHHSFQWKHCPLKSERTVISNLWVWSTLEASWERKVQNRKFIIKI